MDTDAEVEKFLDEQQASLARLAIVLTGNPDAAQDLLQRTFIKVWHHWGRVKVADNPSAYVRRIMANLHARDYRAPRREVTVVDLDQASHLSDDAGIGQLETSTMVRAALSALPPRQRIAVALRYLEDRDDQEIARIIGCRRATVRSHIRRGLTALRTNATLQTDSETEVPTW